MADQRILCMRRDALEASLGGIPLGFTNDPAVISGLQTAARWWGKFRLRSELEEDPAYLQVIVQGLVTREGKYLALFRSVREQRNDRFVETRLNAKVALSAGGHVEPIEAASGDMLHAALLRELSEELVFETPPAPSAIVPCGVVCQAAPGASLLDRVHIGLVFRVPVTRGVSLPSGSDEFDRVEFVGPERLRELSPRMEGWGQLLAEAILAERVPLPSVQSVRSDQ